VTASARRIARGVAIGFVGLFVVLTLPLLVAFGSGYLKNYYLPAEGMAPTLEKGDRFVALMNGARKLERGDIVLLTVDGSIYVKRIAALAGDRIGVREGTVILNGRPIAQRFLAAEQRKGYGGMERARRFAEQFPGEAAPHEILDIESSPVDNFPETKIPSGSIFVLGDNRDRSADSRVPRENGGVELLSVGDVRGRPLFCTRRCKLSR
jgi:signal peptidase I